MKRKLVIFAMLAATTFVGLPAGGNVVSAYSGIEQDRSQTRVYTRREVQPGRRRVVTVRRKTYPVTYRNYGQYRRTQVGTRRTQVANRRYRMVRQYYRNNNGVRVSRMVRVYN